MTKGYAVSTQSYTFSPALPFFGILTNFILQNSFESLVLVALTFGLLWIPLYQLLAENYMSRKSALLSALMLSFSPYLFVFTTVAYSESLLLFFLLGSWVLLKRGNTIGASALATIAPLTRTMGILAVFPMLYYSLKQKTHRVRNTALSLFPVVSLSTWFIGFGFTAGDVLAPVHTSEWTTLYSFRTLLLDGIPRLGLKAILEAPYQNPPIMSHWLLPLAVGASLIFPLLLFHECWKKDKAFWIYAVAGYAGILYYGALVSTPRFVSVLFPLWIPLTAYLSGGRKSIIFVATVITLSYVLAMNLWSSFLGGQFIA